MRKGKNISFSARGGWWVVAQAPVMLLAAGLPPWTRAAWAFRPDQSLQALGWMLFVVGVALAWSGVRTFGRALTPFPRPSDNAVLRQQGVYGIVRHPIYAGLILGAIGWALAWMSWPGLVYVVPLAIFFDRKATYEENLLRAKFRAYGSYQKKVKKLIPWVY